MMRGRLTSRRHDWRTPRTLFAALDQEFHFTLDAAATAENALCPHFFTSKDNALWQSWAHEVVWLNPPYGGDVGRFVQKAFLSSLSGATVVCLVPARTDVAWWHAYALRAAEIRFIRGRVQFDDCGVNAPFASVLLVFGPTQARSPRVVAWQCPEQPPLLQKHMALAPDDNCSQPPDDSP